MTKSQRSARRTSMGMVRTVPGIKHLFGTSARTGNGGMYLWARVACKKAARKRSRAQARRAAQQEGV